MTAIHHVQVAIPAGGEDAARAFYGGLLGLHEIGKPQALRGRGGVWFSTGSLDLHLGVDPDFRPATKAHVAYIVTDLNAVRGGLAGAGYTIREDAPLPGLVRFFVDDPFGNRVEVVSLAAGGA